MKDFSAIAAIIATSLIVFVCVSPFAGQAMAQEGPSVRHASGAWWLCIKEKWPDARIDEHSKKVFIPETGQNLAWDNDKQLWIDVKTGQAVRGACKTLGGACWRSIRNKWPQARIDEHSKKVFIPETGQNLAWDNDKQAWIDVKTGKCICPECPPSRTAQQPTPSTTDKVTDVLRTIGSSVSIGIGGGGGSEHRHHGEDRHRTADKVSTDKTKTHKTSPTTTHKTVTSACKCHPCTCSPCHCH